MAQAVLRRAPQDYEEHEGKRELRVGDKIFRRVYLTRRQALAAFEPARVLLTSLAETWGPDNVRIVAWFDD